MSYDVDVGTADENYTSNMATFFRAFSAYPPEWHGRHRQEVGREIGEALRRIARTDRDILERFNAPNGWGTWESATQFLIRVYLGCFEELPDTVEVSW